MINNEFKIYRNNKKSLIIRTVIILFVLALIPTTIFICKSLVHTEYNIVYELFNGQNNEENPSKFRSGNGEYILRDATRVGYDFGGWFSDYDFTQRVTKISFKTKKNITLYAKWLKKYSIAYELFGGLNNEQNPSSYNVESVFVFKAPTKEWSEFGGWFIDPTFENSVDSINAGTTGDLKVYAKWISFTYSVRFHKNDEKAQGQMNDQLFQFKQPQNLDSIQFVKNGYSFVGWATSPNGAKVYDDAQGVSDICDDVGAVVNLYAVWSANTYRVVFDKNHDSATGEMLEQSFVFDCSQALNENVFENSFHSFVGWSTSSNGSKMFDDAQEVVNLSNINGDVITLYAIWYKDIFITQGCVITGLTEYGKKQKQIVIPDSINGVEITKIGDEAFDSNSVIESITISSKIKEIGSCAFFRCNNLDTLNFENGLTTIGINAFHSCTSLTSLDIPSSVSSIAEGAFRNCTGIVEIDVSTDNQNYMSKDNCLLTKNGEILIVGCKAGVIPQGVKTIGEYAYYYFANFESLTIPESVETIGNNAFYHCSGLKYVNILGELKSIGKNAFTLCRQLKSIVIPKSVSTIGEQAFILCDQLTQVFFGGNSNQDWEKVDADDAMLGDQAKIFYFSETKPTTSGNYWHNVGGVPTIWEEE